ncbi:MAG: hypothetical protein CMA88_01450 [Euryarchaeota archaeon]|nr:hypothetical protein [Euryarchaeota archaeon]|tara:strand:- start:441 stop:1025 length:585 start_codon:yes stop_codon:yes gene_type:complete
MMVRLLSVLPGIIGVICALIVVLSLIGYQPDESGAEVPIVPCTDDDVGCNVGMTGEDMVVPLAFVLLDIELEVDWKEPDRGWIGVVDAAAAQDCPPDSNGLTQCNAGEIEGFLVSGGPQSHGSMEFQVEPGSYRFVAGGYEGSGLDSQMAVLKTSVHLNNYAEVFLAVTSILLLAGAGEMAFPVRNLLDRLTGS